ncbi:Ferredoxin, 2Fe-2S, partial [Sideroxydans sp. CL21]
DTDHCLAACGVVPQGRVVRGRTRHIHLRCIAGAQYRDRTRLRKVLRLHHLSRYCARRIQKSGRSNGPGRRSAGQGMGAGSQFETELPGPGRQAGSGGRDTQVHHKHGEGGTLQM